MMEVVEIKSHGSQGPTYCSLPIPWLLMACDARSHAIISLGIGLVILEYLGLLLCTRRVNTDRSLHVITVIKPAGCLSPFWIITVKPHGRNSVSNRQQLDYLFVSLFKLKQQNVMMTSSNGNIFRVTGHLCGEFTGHRWIPRTKASDAELWYFLWSATE